MTSTIFSPRSLSIVFIFVSMVFALLFLSVLSTSPLLFLLLWTPWALFEPCSAVHCVHSSPTATVSSRPELLP